MRTAEQLFSDPNEYNSFEDALLEARDLPFEPGKRIPLAKQRLIFDALPQSTQDTAHAWGLSDTCFRDAAYTFIQANPDIFDPLFANLYD